MKKYLVISILAISFQLLAQQSKYSLALQIGRTFPSQTYGNFSENGLALSAELDRRISPRFSMFLSGDYEVANAINGDENWYKTSLNLGASFHVLDHKIKTSVFGQIGFAIQNVPQLEIVYPDTKIITRQVAPTTQNIIQGSIGAKISYVISSRISLFVKPQFTGSFSNITYQERDLSPAINDRGVIDEEAANNMPFQTRQIAPANSAINGGIIINFANDWNSTRSNKTSKTS